MTGRFLKVSQLVTPKTRPVGGGWPGGWVVVGTFIAEGNAEPRCIDYRVRAYPASSDTFASIEIRNRIEARLLDQSAGAEDIEDLGEFPPGGIPRWVFERASQSRLFDTARDRINTYPEKYAPIAAEVLNRVPVSRGGRAHIGRPRLRNIGETVRILADVEAAYAEGLSRASVAERHYMSDSALRDMLHWARKVTEPPLFTDPGRGKRGGRLTEEARRLLEGGTDNG